MRVILEIKQSRDLEILLPLLRRLQISVELPGEDSGLATEHSPQESDLEPIPHLAEFWEETETGADAHLRALSEERGNTDLAYVPARKAQKWAFDKFYGAAKSEKSFDEIERELEERRKEWERDI